MKRTTVMLPESLRVRAAARARKLGISLGEFIRRAMASMLQQSRGGADEDPLLADDAVHEGPVPSDLAERHDDYLYGRPEER